MRGYDRTRSHAKQTETNRTKNIYKTTAYTKIVSGKHNVAFKIETTLTTFSFISVFSYLTLPFYLVLHNMKSCRKLKCHMHSSKYFCPLQRNSIFTTEK